LIATVAFIQEFISPLDEKMVRQLCEGPESMEYVDSLLIMQDDENDVEPSEETKGSGGSQPPHSEPTADWRKCRHCQPMSQEIENKCCGLRKCVTTRRRFEKLCLDPEVLALCIRNRADIRNDREGTSTSSFRKTAYRQSRVAPSCVVIRVRRQYPSATRMYMRFRQE